MLSHERRESHHGEAATTYSRAPPASSAIRDVLCRSPVRVIACADRHKSYYRRPVSLYWAAALIPHRSSIAGTESGTQSGAPMMDHQMLDRLELEACTPAVVEPDGFNLNATLPYGLTTEHVQHAMTEFVTFLGFINLQLNSRDIPRLEAILMPANFSSMVGEFMIASIPKYCPSVVKNQYHNGHPDLIPAGRFSHDAVQYTSEGIEVKGSRYARGWQGHNPEEIWLLVFVFESNRPRDTASGISPFPFRFVEVLGGPITKSDWTPAGRSATSRRTPTAAVNDSGYRKMAANWIYRGPASPSGIATARPAPIVPPSPD
jgi:hypothetical protein